MLSFVMLLPYDNPYCILKINLPISIFFLPSIITTITSSLMTNMQRHIHIYSTLYCMTFYYIKRTTNNAPKFVYGSRDKAPRLRVSFHSGIPYIKQGRPVRLDTSILSVHIEILTFCGQQGTK